MSTKRLMVLLCLVGIATLVDAQAQGTGPGQTSPGARRPQGAGGPAAPEGSSNPGPVAVAEVSTLPLTTQAGGRIQPLQVVAHTATVAGMVRLVHVVPGQVVRAGDRLFTIDRDDLTGSFLPATVTARLGGVVSSVPIKVNTVVRVGDPGVGIADTSVLSLTVQVSDLDARNLRPGIPIRGIGVGMASLSGTLAHVSPEPDYTTGLFTAVVRFAPADSTYLGQFVRVDLPTGAVRGVFVNQDALRRTYGRYQLWVVDEAGRLVDRRVNIAAFHGNQALVQDGLAPGERYLVRRTGRERAGDLVEGGGS